MFCLSLGGKCICHRSCASVGHAPSHTRQGLPKSTIGMITDNDMVRPTPPVLRALKEVKEALEAAGHTVIEWKS